MVNPRGQARIEAQKRWRAAHPEYKPASGDKERASARIAQIEAAINTCYLKEARAMLEGKDVRGKNRCVKLPGD